MKAFTFYVERWARFLSERYVTTCHKVATGRYPLYPYEANILNFTLILSSNTICCCYEIKDNIL